MPGEDAASNPLLGLETRRRLYAVVRQYPGIHVREAARQLDTSLALVEYHLQILRDSGLVTVEKDERYSRIYARDDVLGPRDRAALAVLRERLPLQVTLHLLDGGPAKHKDVAATLGMGKSKLSFHLRKLEAAGIVAKAADGRFAIADATRVQRLLSAYPPTQDLRDEFADVWLSLYGD